MKITKLTPQIYFVECKDIRKLSLSFMRFQEYYENPKFKGQIFTVKEFKTWYRKKFGKFTYCTDWGGFNIPSTALDPFREGKFKKLTQLEKNFLKKFPKTDKPYYIIGAQEYNSETFNHEIAHALFFTNPKYKTYMTKEVSKIKLDKLYKWFKKMGYHKDVWIDEAQAYVGANLDDLLKDKTLDKPNKSVKNIVFFLNKHLKSF